MRIYVNCSLGDELSDEDLAEEAAAAEKAPESPTTTSKGDAAPPPSTRPRPRGFDRLLTTGFTPSEISTLRTQFVSIQSERYPPDALPSPDTMRSLEDAWIDSNAAGGGGPRPGDDDDPSRLAHGLDVFVRAMMIGFFFPLGSFTWAMRQDGIWGDKWQVFVAAGALLSVVTGVVMHISGDFS